MHFNETLVPYFAQRGIIDEGSIKNFIKIDLYNLAHALTAIFSQDQQTILKNFFGESKHLIQDKKARIGHIGRELLGPLDFYLLILRENASILGLQYLSHLVFLSTQVVKNLAQDDPDIKGVSIGQIYFQEQHSEKTVFLELFSPALLDGTFPQTIHKTLEVSHNPGDKSTNT